jgi:hypothetical protein
LSLSLISFGCAVCFGGDPSSLSSKALVAAVFFLGGVVVAVLIAIAWTAFVWGRREKALEGAE